MQRLQNSLDFTFQMTQQIIEKLKRWLWLWKKKFADVDFIDVASQIFQAFLRNVTNKLKSLLFYIQWLLAPGEYVTLILRHGLLFILCSLVYPVLQRLIITPFLRASNDALLYTVFGAANLREIRGWRKKMSSARTYKEWKKAGEELGKIDGSLDWRENPKCKYYDHRRIRSDTATVSRYMKTGKTKDLMQFLRARLYRNCGGILSDQLHPEKCVGTKIIIEEYVKWMCRALHFIARDGQTPPAERLSFFNEIRHTYGRSAFLAGGGSSFGLYHFGVVLELMAQGLLPKVISGSSVGSIMVAFLCCLTTEEFQTLCCEEGGMDFRFFDKKSKRSTLEVFFIRIQRAFRSGYFLDISILRDLVQGHIGDITFMEAYEKTGRVMNINVMPATDHNMPRTLNYLTAPNVVVWSASICSCAIPGILQAQELLEKDERGELVPFIQEGMEFSDGSFGHDMPMDCLSQWFNVNHFVVSQVNPFLVPFVVDSMVPEIVRMCVQLFANEMICITRWLCKLGKEYSIGYFSRLLNIVYGLATQRYFGDITIHPSPQLFEYMKLLSNPNEELKKSCIEKGRKLIWGKLSRLKIHCSIEFCLDDCLRQMRGALIMETQQHSNNFSEPIKQGNRFSTQDHMRSENGMDSMKLKTQSLYIHDAQKNREIVKRLQRQDRVESWTPQEFDKFTVHSTSDINGEVASELQRRSHKDGNSKEKPERANLGEEAGSPRVEHHSPGEVVRAGKSREETPVGPSGRRSIPVSRSEQSLLLKYQERDNMHYEYLTNSRISRKALPSLVCKTETGDTTLIQETAYEEPDFDDRFIPEGMKKSELGLPRSLSCTELFNENITSSI